MARVTPDERIGSTKIAASPTAAQPSPWGSGAHDDQSRLHATRFPSGRKSSRRRACFTRSATSGQLRSISQKNVSRSTSFRRSLKCAEFVTAPTLMRSSPMGKYQIHPFSTDARKTLVRSREPLYMTFQPAFAR
jgi:hypothetical protein